MLAINTLLQKRYRVINILGHGGMGAVYEAKDERLGSLVALKEIIFNLDKLQTEKQRKIIQNAFEREAKLLANLHHEVFPRVMDYFFEEKHQFLVMELIHGNDLSELLETTSQPFELLTTLKWAEYLLDALDYLHTQMPPIFHRDIKPGNLKVTNRGKIKLLDFGIARSVDLINSITTTNKTLIGATLEYAPIEQVLPATLPAFREFIILKHNEKAQEVLNQKTDARCDLYSLGATFYHFLTNSIPIDSAKRSLEIWEDNADPLLSPDEVNSLIPQSISQWIMKAMEVDRDNRFSSAIEMQTALLEALESQKKPETNVIKAIPLINQDQLLDEKEISQDHSSFTHETEKLIKLKEIETEELLNSESNLNKFTDIDSSSTNDTDWKSKSQNLEDVSSSTPYFDESLFNKKEIVTEKLPIIKNEAKKDSKSNKNLLTTLILSMSILLVGGLFWWAIYKKQTSNQITVNNVTTTPVNFPINSTTNINQNTNISNISNSNANIPSNLINSSSQNQNSNIFTTPKPTSTPIVTSTEPIIAKPTETPIVKITPKPTPNSVLNLGRINALLTELRSEPNSQGYIINYGSSSEIAERQRNILSYIKSRGFDSSRIVMVNGGRLYPPLTKLYVVPAGVAPPSP